MSTPAAPNESIAKPTWYSDIRQMFTPTDITHMRSQGLDLAAYEVVKANARIIYGQVASGNMPPGNPWSQAWAATFVNWINSGCPKGINAPSAFHTKGLLAAAPAETTATRIRKNIVKLSATELANLTKAFNGILAKDPSDPNSFFKQAGIHWLPGANGNGIQFYCQHHTGGYNPWHRAYLFGFENALRSVPGCENVTLPYWDITTPIPDVLKQPPFASYILPQKIGSGFDRGYTTSRYDDATIAHNMRVYGVVDDLNNAMQQTDWEDFHGGLGHAQTNSIIAAHDGGHVSIGQTMADQNVAAFDPIFFFFHANWDRLFWQWQKSMQATDLNGLLSTINRTTDPYSYQIFTDADLATLPPFNLTSPGIINSVTSLGVDYDSPKASEIMNFLPKTQLSALADDGAHVKVDLVNVRVGGVNRLKIPGSFSVHLLRDGERIASKAFFQPDEAHKCEMCVKNAIANFDFKLPLSAVSGGKLTATVEPVNHSAVGDRFPHKMMGNPTIDVRFLLSSH